MNQVETVRWSDGEVEILDQTRLPAEEIYLRLGTAAEMVEAIRALRVRGAPAIGVAAAMGLAAEAHRRAALPPEEFGRRVRDAAELLRQSRPTAVNLGWALDRMLRAAGLNGAGAGSEAAGAAGSEAAGAAVSEAAGAAGSQAGDGSGLEAASGAGSGARSDTGGSPGDVARRMAVEAQRILDEDRAMCRAIGEHGLEVLPPEEVRLLTHCNAGALATAGIGTALAPVYVAHEAGRRLRIFAGETRPLLQGSRLTAWELGRAGVDVTLVTDSMAGWLMQQGRVDLVMVGADRIAANGDVANKIGTYSLAVLARHHGIPFYVAAPVTTLDLRAADRTAIPIEERDPDEVRRGFGRLTAPADAPVLTPAFDLTPAELITAIITDRGVLRPPFGDAIRSLYADHPLD